MDRFTAQIVPGGAAAGVDNVKIAARHTTRDSGDTAPVIISGENSVIAKPRSEGSDQDLVS